MFLSVKAIKLTTIGEFATGTPCTLPPLDDLCCSFNCCNALSKMVARTRAYTFMYSSRLCMMSQSAMQINSLETASGKWFKEAVVSSTRMSGNQKHTKHNTVTSLWTKTNKEHFKIIVTHNTEVWILN